jgi:hypothetical protein
MTMNKGKMLNLALAAGFAVFAVTACSSPVAAMHAPGGMEAWEHNHPEASHALAKWVKEHPDAANKFFEWDARHTERAHAFVTWSITHPGEGPRKFAETHPDWEMFDEIMRDHLPAARSFMEWCRHFPDAAEALMNHPGGLAWAGHHIYAN